MPAKWTQPLGDNIAKGGLTCAYEGANPVPLDLHDLTRRTLTQARRVLMAHSLLNDDGTIRQAERADLYADAASMEIAHRPVMRIDHRFAGGTLAIGVDYLDTPAVIANSHKKIITHLQNPQPLTLDPWKQYEGLAIGNQTVQELVHSLNTATAFLLICPLIGGALGLIFALAAQKD